MEWLYILTALFLLIMLIGFMNPDSAVKTDFSKKRVKSASLYYYLPESWIKIKAKATIEIIYKGKKIFKEDDGSPPKVQEFLENNSYKFEEVNVLECKFEISDCIKADTEYLFALNHNSNPLWSDDLKFMLSPEGFLNTIEVITEDRISQIVSSLSAVVLLKGSDRSERGFEDLDFNLYYHTGAEIEREVGVEYEYKSKIIMTESVFCKKACDLLMNGSIPIKWEFLRAKELKKDGSESVEKDISNIDFKINLTHPEPAGKNGSVKNLLDKFKKLNDDYGDEVEEIDGIFTRPTKNIQLGFKFESNNKGLQHGPVFLSVIDSTKLIAIPIKRAPFVKGVNKIKIENGLITSHEINRPSSLEGFISIPLNIAKAIISLPAQIVRFRYNKNIETDMEVKSLEDQTKLLKAELEAEKLRKELKELRKKK